MLDKNLQGEFPSSFHKSYYMGKELHNNMLMGYLPIPSVHASDLELLDLSQDRFTSVILAEISSLLPMLEFLSYSQNDLSGIPNSFGLLKILRIWIYQKIT